VGLHVNPLFDTFEGMAYQVAEGLFCS